MLFRSLNTITSISYILFHFLQTVCCGYDNDGIVRTPPTETAAEIADEKKYMPQWFGRDDGWTGATYSEAIEFCATNEGLVICPHDAFCPDGVDTAPLGETGGVCSAVDYSAIV